MAKVRICFYFYANFINVCYDQREFHQDLRGEFQGKLGLAGINGLREK